jgi:8-oxo-dGTP diphosphatase
VRAVFEGSKAALFIGARLLVILRDDRPDIPWPGHWDFPGGGREGDETPEATLRREVREEVGLELPDASLVWARRFATVHPRDGTVWFFVARLPAAAEQDIVFGDEGQRWALMDWSEFAGLPNIVPSYAPRMAIWQAETGGL